MSTASTIRMLKAYEEQGTQKPGFLTSFFQTPPENFHSAEVVEIDVRRSGFRVAPVLTNLSAGLNRTESQQYVNKDWAPPIYGEEFSLNSYKLLSRPIGQNPFQDVDFMTSMNKGFFAEMRIREEMIRRSIELQAAQIFRTGQLSLSDAQGNVGFTLNYSPKASHFFTPGVAWNAGSGWDRLGNVRTLCDLINVDGQVSPDTMIMGPKAKEAFVTDATVVPQFTAAGTGIGRLQSPVERNGGVYHGKVSVGNYSLDLWTAPKQYQAYSTGTATQYIGDWEVIILSSSARYDLTFGNIPSWADVDPRLAGLAVGRLSSSAGKVDLITNAWLSGNGRILYGSCEARPLCIPTAIDTFGCITTV